MPKNNLLFNYLILFNFLETLDLLGREFEAYLNILNIHILDYKLIRIHNYLK
jgi:hypothetical protein